jgi:hypothetical protein
MRYPPPPVVRPPVPSPNTNNTINNISNINTSNLLSISEENTNDVLELNATSSVTLLTSSSLNATFNDSIPLKSTAIIEGFSSTIISEQTTATTTEKNTSITESVDVSISQQPQFVPPIPIRPPSMLKETSTPQLPPPIVRPPSHVPRPPSIPVLQPNNTSVKPPPPPPKKVLSVSIVENEGVLKDSSGNKEIKNDSNVIVIDNNVVVDDEHFRKYRKMKDMLPPGAVKQKMTTDGYDANDIDSFLNGDVNFLPLPTVASISNGINVMDLSEVSLRQMKKTPVIEAPKKVSLLDEIQKGAKLKSVQPEDERMKKPAAIQGAGGLLGMLATAMNTRRIHMKVEDDDDDDSDSSGFGSDDSSD